MLSARRVGRVQTWGGTFQRIFRPGALARRSLADASGYYGVAWFVLLLCLSFVDLAMPRFRPRLRFSLSTLFVLMTIVCGWLGYQLNWIRQRRAVLHHSLVEHLDLLPGETTPRAPGLLWLLGERGTLVLIIRDDREAGRVWTDAQLDHIEDLFPEAVVHWNSRSTPLLESR